MRSRILIFFFLIFSPITIYAASQNLDLVNQKVCDRFEGDVSKLAAIMEEKRTRIGITETRVAYGGSNTPVKNADYWVNFAAEAIAYQRAQKYSSSSQLRFSLEGLRNKILTAKLSVGKALDSNE